MEAEEVSQNRCDGAATVRVDNTFAGFGSTKEAALAALLDSIARDPVAQAACESGTCSDERLSCVPTVDESELGNATLYARAGGQWKAFLFGPRQGGQNKNVSTYCSCAPQSV